MSKAKFEVGDILRGKTDCITCQLDGPAILLASDGDWSYLGTMAGGAFPAMESNYWFMLSDNRRVLSCYTANMASSFVKDIFLTEARKALKL